MSDETVIEDEVEDEAEDEGGVKPTDDLASYDEIHAQAAANRRAIGPIADDPTVVTAGTDGIPPPGPGPEPDESIPESLAMPGAGAYAPAESVEDGEEQAEAAAYDPGAHTVSEVLQYIADNPEEEEAVLAAEAAGKNRASIVG